MNINNVNNSIRNFLSTFSSDEQCSPKKIKKILYGLQNQTDRLKDSVKDLFSSQDNISENDSLQFSQKVSDTLEEIKEHLDKCKTYIRVDEKINFLEDLNNIRKDCNQQLKYIDELINDINNENSVTLTKKNKLNQLHELYCLNKNDEIVNTFKNVALKLKKLKAKSELQNTQSEVTDRISNHFIRWFNKLISKDFITKEIENSSKIDYKKIEDYITLQKEWITAYEGYKLLQSTIKENLIKLEINPFIIQFSQKIKKCREWFDFLNSSLEKISLRTLASGFKEKYIGQITNEKTRTSMISFKRDFTDFFNDLQTYAKCKTDLDQKKSALLKLEQFKQNKACKIDSILDQISTEISSLKTQKDSFFENYSNESSASEPDQETISIEDEKSIEACDKKVEKRLKDLQNNRIKNFETLQNEILNQWNQCCLELNETRCLEKLFNHFCGITEQLSLCYFIAEEIHSDLRTLRKTEDNIFKHLPVIENKIREFKTLYNLITNIERSNNNECSISNPQILKFNQILCIDPSLLTLAEEISQINSKKLDLNLTNADMKFSTSDQEKENNKTIEKQNKFYSEEFEKQKKNIILYFKDKDDKIVYLKKICDIVVSDINCEGTTLQWSEDLPKFYEKFTGAYYSENRAAMALQACISYVGLGAQKVISVINDQPSSQFDESHRIKDFVFNAVESPFNRLKKLIQKL